MKIIRYTIKALEALDNYILEGLPRCENCGKPITPWQRVCKWCGYEQW